MGSIIRNGTRSRISSLSPYNRPHFVKEGLPIIIESLIDRSLHAYAGSDYSLHLSGIEIWEDWQKRRNWMWTLCRITAALRHYTNREKKSDQYPWSDSQLIINIWVRDQGFEPWTPWLRVRCSASWASRAYLCGALYLSHTALPIYH